MATFNIGPQNAGVINNVGGDQTINQGQHGTLAMGHVEALAALRAAVQTLPPETAEAAKAELDEAADALDRPEPDKPRAARALERLTRTLTSAGAFAAAGAALIGPLEALGRFLGPIGATVLSLLPAL